MTNIDNGLGVGLEPPDIPDWDVVDL